MNSIAINSIKTSVVLGGFYPLPAARRCAGDGGGRETRSRGKSSKQSSRRSMNSWHRGNNSKALFLILISIIIAIDVNFARFHRYREEFRKTLLD